MGRQVNYYSCWRITFRWTFCFIVLSMSRSSMDQSSRDPCHPMLSHRLSVSNLWWTEAANLWTTWFGSRKAFITVTFTGHEPRWSSSETAEERTMPSRTGFQNEPTAFNMRFFPSFSAFFKICAENLSVRRWFLGKGELHNSRLQFLCNCICEMKPFRTTLLFVIGGMEGDPVHSPAIARDCPLCRQCDAEDIPAHPACQTLPRRCLSVSDEEEEDGESPIRNAMKMREDERRNRRKKEKEKKGNRKSCEKKRQNF